MTWGEANHIHRTYSHERFLSEAKFAKMSRTAIWNVCTNQSCTKREEL